MGFQGTGEVNLRSANPEDPPLIDPKFLSHPYDRRVSIEAVRAALEFLDMPYLAKDQIRLATGPEGRSDEEIFVGLSLDQFFAVFTNSGSADSDTDVIRNQTEIRPRDRNKHVAHVRHM